MVVQWYNLRLETRETWVPTLPSSLRLGPAAVTRIPDRYHHRVSSSATSTLLDTNLRYQELDALDWRKWTKEDSDADTSFVRRGQL